MARPPGLLPSGCAGGLRGFSTARPCTGEKLAGLRAGHPADFPSPTRRAIGAPGEAARSCAQKQQREQEHPTPALPCTQGREKAETRRFAPASVSALAVAVASGAHDARLLFRGPWAAVRWGRQGRDSGRGQGRPCLFARAGARSKSPGPASRTCRPWMDGKRQPGVVFSWLLLFDSGHPALRPCGPASPFARAPARAWTSKREVARAPTGARNRSECRTRDKSRGPSPALRAALPASGRGDTTARLTPAACDTRAAS